MAVTEITFDSWIPIRRDHRLFVTLYDLTILVGALGVAFRGIATGKVEYENNAVMAINAPRTVCTYGISMFLPLNCALWGEEMEQNAIGIVEDHKAQLDPETSINTTGLHAPAGHIASSIFLAFFEPYNVWLTQKLGDGINWPPTLNFARVVRNSAAHGGIDIRNPKSPAVSWRGLTYTHADNGTVIIPNAIGLGDLLTLLLDVASDLDALSAPVL